MRTLVIDASVALKWFVEEDGSAPARALLLGSDMLIAPDLIVAEVCNAAWKAVRNGTMLPAQQDHAARRLGAVLDEFVPLAGLAARAAILSRTLDHPAYDCFYVALAEARDTQMITADRRLLGRVRETQWDSCVLELGLAPPPAAAIPRPPPP